MERLKKQLRFRAVFSFPVTARKSNPWRPPWRGAARHRPEGRKSVRGAKESFSGAKDGLRVKWNQGRAGADQFHGRAFSSEIGENPYAVPRKGKTLKKVQLPKEVHKVHTAL
ncbi:hypothetical protein GA616_02415, partial [Bifidobacterium adolescentis]